MSKIKFEVIPHYVDEILVDGRKSYKALIKKANAVIREHGMGNQYSFNDDDEFDTECAIEMEFYDGIALATDGCGLYMTYPKLEEVAKSPARQERIQEYTGIYDGTINQHDVALCYGVLKFFSLAARLVRDAALRFEKKWNDEMKGNDGYDYIMEMDRFEQEELERLRKIYDEN